MAYHSLVMSVFEISFLNKKTATHKEVLKKSSIPKNYPLDMILRFYVQLFARFVALFNQTHCVTLFALFNEFRFLGSF